MEEEKTTEVVFVNTIVFTKNIYNRLKEHNVEFIHPIEQQQWWQNVLRCYDPDHHIVEIGEPYRVDFESEEETISY